VDPGNGNYTLRPESPAIDGALSISGINEQFAGGAPDMGAHEFGLSSVPGNLDYRGRPALRSVNPNPAQDGASVLFETTREGRVTLMIHDATGRRVRRLLDRRLQAGEHSVIWDGKDDSARVLPSGTYFYRLILNGKQIGSEKTAVLK
jgi:hypothetical protein